MEPSQPTASTNDALKLVGVLNARKTILGIPSAYAVMGAALSGIFLYIAPLVIGAAIAAMILVPLYLVHQNDPYGLETLLESLQQPLVYEAGVAEPLRLILLHESNDAIHFDDPWSLSIRK